MLVSQLSIRLGHVQPPTPHADRLLSMQQHPVSEAIFNFAGAWSFMLLPLFIWDRKSKRKVGMWTCILFLTNFLMFPYMALRALPVDKPIEEQGPRPPEVSSGPGSAAWL